jgi:argininosuccinate lyase
MPQKKNPDSLELIRGKAGRVFGHHAALLATMKGLPLAYNKDMQEDKEAVFDTVDTVSICLRVVAIVLNNITVNEEKTREAATRGYLNATELADYLVKKGVPFPHSSRSRRPSRAVLLGIESGKELHELSLAELRKFSPKRAGCFQGPQPRSNTRIEKCRRRHLAKTCSRSFEKGKNKHLKLTGRMGSFFLFILSVHFIPVELFCENEGRTTC